MKLSEMTAEQFAYKCFPLNDAYDPHDNNADLRAELLRKLKPLDVQAVAQEETPPGWTSCRVALPEDGADVLAAIWWINRDNPAYSHYAIHDCAYYEGGPGSNQNIFTDCEGEEFEAEDVSFWIEKGKLAKQFAAPGTQPPESVKLVSTRPPTEDEIKRGEALADEATSALDRNKLPGTQPQEGVMPSANPTENASTGRSATLAVGGTLPAASAALEIGFMQWYPTYHCTHPSASSSEIAIKFAEFYAAELRGKLEAAERERDEARNNLTAICVEYVSDNEPINGLIHSIVQLSSTEDGRRLLRAKLHTEKLLEAAESDAKSWEVCAANFNSARQRAESSLADARKTIKLIMGCHCGKPWMDMPDSDVDAWIEEGKRLAQPVCTPESAMQTCTQREACLKAGRCLRNLPEDKRVSNPWREPVPTDSLRARCPKCGSGIRVLRSISEGETK